MYTVVPSLPAQSFAEIESLAEALRGEAPALQIDIVDGEFVPRVSWPFTEADPSAELELLSKISQDFSLDIDCMIMNPEQYLDTFVEIGSARVTIHLRSTKAYEDIIKHARAHGYQIALALTNDVPLTELTPLIDFFDAVQIMGIKEVGQQGQPFDERTLETAQILRSRYPDLEITVDGSVNQDTIVRLKAAGANRFAPGSAIAKQPDPAAAYHHLVSLIS